MTQAVPQHVAAVVISYHPDADVLLNLAAVRPQVRTLIVVDNGSSAAELEPLRAASLRLGFELVENGENFGIATALNLGVRRALELAADWLLLFDQDSRVTDGFATAMIAGFQHDPDRQRLGILVPRYIDMRLGTAMVALREPDGTLETVITSGSLIPAATLRRHGLFVDELFIDGVDHEYSLRLRAAGLVLKECSEAELLHSPGTPNSHHMPFRSKPFLSANYSPIRRYYQERNKIWLIRRYGRIFPAFCLRQVRVSIRELIKILFFEQDSLRKCRFFFRGILHGLAGRFGRLL